MKCQICKEEVYADCLWGTDNSRFVATLCEKHLEEIHQKINPLLKINKAFIIFDLPGNIKKEYC